MGKIVNWRTVTARRIKELEAAAPTRRKRGTEPFVKMPLRWAEQAAKATSSPATLVLVELLRASWKARSSTFPLSNDRLRKLGVSREVKRRVLRDLEEAGLIAVKRLPGRAPIVTSILL